MPFAPEPRRRTIEQAERLLDCVDGRLAEKVVVDTKMPTASREQYRHLAAVLHDAVNAMQPHAMQSIQGRIEDRSG